MKVQMIYDQGTALYREDGLFVVGCRLFGVLDGTSAPYAPKYPPKMFNGMSGGEMVSRLCERLCYVQPDINLEQLIQFLNESVGKEQEIAGILHNDAGELAGSTFAFARVNKKTIEICQAGDCFALWVTRDGKTYITQNQVRAHDTDMNAELDRLQMEVAAERNIKLSVKLTEEELKPIRGEVWNRFCPTLKEARRQDVNNPTSPRAYGRLDGNPRLMKLMTFYKFPRQDLRILILFSDGMLPWSRMKNMTDEQVGNEMHKIYKKSGLRGILAKARHEERKLRAKRYLSYAEATAIALNFSDEK